MGWYDRVFRLVGLVGLSVGLTLGFAPGLSAATMSMSISEKCYKNLRPGSEYVTVVIRYSNLSVWEDDGTSGDFEFDISTQVTVYERDAQGQILATPCSAKEEKEFEVPVWNISMSGRRDYDLDVRVKLIHVPIRSAVMAAFQVVEDDDYPSTDDHADFRPSANHADWDTGLSLQINTLNRSVMVLSDDPNRTVAAGRPFRVSGDGKADDDYYSPFKAGVTVQVDIVAEQVPGQITGTVVDPNAAALAKAVGNACRNYALKAVEQNREQEKLGCGFTGSRWSNNHQNQFEWCMRGNNNRTAPGETRFRDDKLAACRQAAAQPPAASPIALCNAYADRAIGMLNQARANGCVMTAPNWSPNRADHYNWCLLFPDANMLATETARRQAELSRCLNP